MVESKSPPRKRDHKTESELRSTNLILSGEALHTTRRGVDKMPADFKLQQVSHGLDSMEDARHARSFVQREK